MLAMAVAAVELAGCVLMYPTDPYTPVASAYRDGPAARPVPSNRALRELDHPLTLGQCLELALANNPQIAQRLWETRAANAQRNIAASQQWPTVTAQGAYTRTLDDQRLVGLRKPGEPGIWSSDIFSADIVLNMPLFTGGRIVNEIGAAELLALAAERKLARTKEELAFNVASTFYSILGQRQVIKSLEFSRKALEEHEKRSRDLIAVQRAARVDLLRTQVRLADIQQQLVRQRNVLAILHRALANLLGVPEDLSTVSISGELAHPGAAQGPPADISTALARREDYLAERARVEAQAKRVDAARANSWPQLSLAASYGERWSAGNTRRQPGADTSEDVGSIGLLLSVPLFEGGRIEQTVLRERAKLAAAQEALRELELKIRLEVSTAALNVQSSQARVKATETAIEQARESLRIEREKYALGKGTITDVLDAQSALLTAEMTHARALTDYNTSVAQLRLATGERITDK